MNETKLLNCPFCGGQIFVRPYIYKNEPSIKPKYAARCENPKCPCCVQSKIYNTIDEAIEAWNTRKPMERILERLEEEPYINKGGELFLNGDNEDCLPLRKVFEIVKEEGGIRNE